MSRNKKKIKGRRKVRTFDRTTFKNKTVTTSYIDWLESKLKSAIPDRGKRQQYLRDLIAGLETEAVIENK